MQAVIFFAFFLLVDLFGWHILSSFKLFKYTGHPLFMFRLRNAALQTGLGRPRELLFLDLYFGLLASSRDPNFTGRHLLWLGLRVVGSSYILLSSRNPKTNWCLSRIYGVRFGEKDLGLSTCKPWSEQAGGLGSILHEAAQDFEVF